MPKLKTICKEIEEKSLIFKNKKIKRLKFLCFIYLFISLQNVKIRIIYPHSNGIRRKELAFLASSPFVFLLPHEFRNKVFL